MARNVMQRMETEDFTTHIHEITRRMAILDFLALYEQARQDEIIGRIKYITQSAGFDTYNPTGWELYITRLLGRCLRYWLPYPSVIEKQRNRMAYMLHVRQIPEFQDIVRITDVLKCRNRYNPHYRIWRQVNQSPRQYWISRPGVDREMVEALYRWYARYSTRMEGLGRVNLASWPGATLTYGQPVNQYYYQNYHRYGHQNPYYRSRTFGFYNSAEAYTEFKRLLMVVGSLYEDPEILQMINILSSYDVQDERRVEQNREFAERNARVRTVQQTTVRNIPNDQLMAELRRRGLIPPEPVAEEPEPPATTSELGVRLLDRLRARGRLP